jgi:T-complex protein 1 subunit zeta
MPLLPCRFLFRSNDKDAHVILKEECAAGNVVGIDLKTGNPLDPMAEGIYDNYRVHRHVIHSAYALLTNVNLLMRMQHGDCKQLVVGG